MGWGGQGTQDLGGRRSHHQYHLNQVSSTVLRLPFRFSLDAEVAARYLTTVANSLTGVYSDVSLNDKDIIM